MVGSNSSWTTYPKHKPEQPKKNAFARWVFGAVVAGAAATLVWNAYHSKGNRFPPIRQLTEPVGGMIANEAPKPAGADYSSLNEGQKPAGTYWPWGTFDFKVLKGSTKDVSLEGIMIARAENAEKYELILVMTVNGKKEISVASATISKDGKQEKQIFFDLAGGPLEKGVENNLSLPAVDGLTQLKQLEGETLAFTFVGTGDLSVKLVKAKESRQF